VRCIAIAYHPYEAVRAHTEARIIAENEILSLRRITHRRITTRAAVTDHNVRFSLSSLPESYSLLFICFGLRYSRYAAFHVRRVVISKVCLNRSESKILITFFSGRTKLYIKAYRRIRRQILECWGFCHS